jgi:hypothetical protein
MGCEIGGSLSKQLGESPLVILVVHTTNVVTPFRESDTVTIFAMALAVVRCQRVRTQTLQDFGNQVRDFLQAL